MGHHIRIGWLVAIACTILTVGCAKDRHQAGAKERIAEAARTGRAEARADLDEGKLGLRVYGLRRPQAVDYDQALADLFDIKVEVVAGCVVSAELVANANAYNEVMEAAIKRRFGPAWSERARQAAQAEGANAGT